MKNQDNNQPGGQTHAEGEYGDKAREANRARLQQEGERDAESARRDEGHDREGGHRLREDRQQHDEADLRSDKNRLARDEDKRDKGPGSPTTESRKCSREPRTGDHWPAVQSLCGGCQGNGTHLFVVAPDLLPCLRHQRFLAARDARSPT